MMKRWGWGLPGVLVCVAGALGLGAQQMMRGSDAVKSVPTAPDTKARPQPFRDSKYGVRFNVPAGWSLNRKDGQVSTFHADARTAPRAAEMRGVASLDFNPFPQSVLSGATFYYSVEKHAKDEECAGQVTAPGTKPDVQDIGGMEFRHAHDEHGGICTEARDEVYTAYRKGACYRFDLEVNTFCSVSSGAQDLSVDQMRAVEERMVDILSTVALDWKKGGTHPVPVPSIVVKPKTAEPELVPRTGTVVGVGQ